MIKELNAANFVGVIETRDKPVLIDFWADWCGPCRMMSSRLEELAGEMKDRAVVAKVNVDDESMLSDSYNVQTIPTLLLFHNGEIVQEFVGLTSKEQIKSTIEKYLH